MSVVKARPTHGTMLQVVRPGDKHIHVCIYIYTHVCTIMCIYIYIYVYTCMYVCIYIYMYINRYTYIYIYIYMYRDHAGHPLPPPSDMLYLDVRALTITTTWLLYIYAHTHIHMLYMYTSTHMLVHITQLLLPATDSHYHSTTWWMLIAVRIVCVCVPRAVPIGVRSNSSNSIDNTDNSSNSNDNSKTSTTSINILIIIVVIVSIIKREQMRNIIDVRCLCPRAICCNVRTRRSTRSWVVLRKSSAMTCFNYTQGKRVLDSAMPCYM